MTSNILTIFVNNSFNWQIFINIIRYVQRSRRIWRWNIFIGRTSAFCFWNKNAINKLCKCTYDSYSSIADYGILVVCPTCSSVVRQCLKCSCWTRRLSWIHRDDRTRLSPEGGCVINEVIYFICWVTFSPVNWSHVLSSMFCDSMNCCFDGMQNESLMSLCTPGWVLG
jgi:hypothetical protein